MIALKTCLRPLPLCPWSDIDVAVVVQSEVHSALYSFFLHAKDNEHSIFIML